MQPQEFRLDGAGQWGGQVFVAARVRVGVERASVHSDGAGSGGGAGQFAGTLSRVDGEGGPAG